MKRIIEDKQEKEAVEEISNGEATKEIAELIKGIQEETRNAVKAIEVGSKKAEQGNKLAEETRTWCS